MLGQLATDSVIKRRASDSPKSQPRTLMHYQYYPNTANCIWQLYTYLLDYLHSYKLREPSCDEVNYNLFAYCNVQKTKSPSRRPYVLLDSAIYQATYIYNLNPTLVSTLKVLESLLHAMNQLHSIYDYIATLFRKRSCALTPHQAVHRLCPRSAIPLTILASMTPTRLCVQLMLEYENVSLCK